MMQLGVPRLERSGVDSRVTVDVSFGDASRIWWIQVPQQYEGLLDLGMSPWVPAATTVACAIGEDLIFAAPVSAGQLKGARNAAALYSQWWNWRPSVITADVSDPHFPSGPGTGLLFTRGIDSTATLIDSMRGNGPKITHLLEITGIEPSHSPSVAAAISRDTERAAASVGVPLIPLATNLRSEVEPFAIWEHSFGAVLISASLGLGPLFKTLLISSTLSDDYRKPHGSTPELDEGWSTARSNLVTTHRTLDRMEKTAIVSSEPELARQLKVCWLGNQRGNCGRCTKCLMTMSAFAAVGTGAAFESFDKPLSVDAIRRLVPPRTSTDDLATGDAAHLSEHEPTWPSNMEPVLDRLAAIRPELHEAWLDFRARSLYGQRAGLADSTALDITRERADLGIARGWGGGALPLSIAASVRHRLCSLDVAPERPLRWVIAQRVSSGSAQLSALLSEHWERGAVMLVDSVTPGIPPHAVRKLLGAATVRCWWSDERYLEAVPLLEAVNHGCIPIQITTDDRAAEIRSELGTKTGILVMGVTEIEFGFPGPEMLHECLRAAVQLVTTGSRERDHALARFS